MCVQRVLSDASSKRPSGVAAELEWLLLGDAAMAIACGTNRPGHATKRCFPTLAMPRSARPSSVVRPPLCLLLISIFLALSCPAVLKTLWYEDEKWDWFRYLESH